MAGIKPELPAAAIAMGKELAVAEIGDARGQAAIKRFQSGGSAEQGFAAHWTYHGDSPLAKPASNLTLSCRISPPAESGPEPRSRIVPAFQEAFREPDMIRIRGIPSYE
ncbi:hypothetical protein DLREEDagr8_18120 [Dongia sp. agr-C8]